MIDYLLFALLLVWFIMDRFDIYFRKLPDNE